MREENELIFWMSEGNLFRAEKIYLQLLQELPLFKNTETAQKLRTELIEHQQQIAGKAILSKDIPLLKSAISKLEIYKQDTTELRLALKKLKLRIKTWYSLGFGLVLLKLLFLYYIIY